VLPRRRTQNRVDQGHGQVPPGLAAKDFLEGDVHFGINTGHHVARSFFVWSVIAARNSLANNLSAKLPSGVWRRGSAEADHDVASGEDAVVPNRNNHQRRLKPLKKSRKKRS
jgi:hypothetical protein